MDYTDTKTENGATSKHLPEDLTKKDQKVIGTHHHQPAKDQGSGQPKHENKTKNKHNHTTLQNNSLDPSPLLPGALRTR